MEKKTLKVQKRETVGKAVRAMRKEGIVPAVVYGKGKENQNLSVSLHDFNLIYKEVGSSAIITLAIDGGEKNVLIHDVSLNPVTNVPEHIDFYEVSMTEKITAVVPLHFAGDSAAVIELQGSLLTNKDEVEVECLPADLPQNIEVDISVLTDFEKDIHISDLKVPDGVEVKDDPEELVANVEPPRSEEELAELEEPIEAPEMEGAEEGALGEEAAEGEEGEEKAEGKSAEEGGEEKPAEGAEPASTESSQGRKKKE